jgi:hypothetical protein
MNTVKYETYKNEMINLDKAIKFGFYLEAISISYAAIEDRLNSYLIHIGLVNNKEKLKVNKRFNYLYKYLLNKEENERNKISNISEKIDIIKVLLLYSNNNELEQELIKPKDIKYFNDLIDTVNKLNKELLLSTLEELTNIIKVRNVLIHALLNRRVEDSFKNKEECALRLKQIFRVLDKELVRPVKRKNFRTKYNIQ